MSKRYYTHNVYLESADFHILIVQFPEEDVNDKLAQLATERGLIYRHFYEDFIIGMCMANAGPFFFHIRKRPELLIKFSDIRQEALALVYKYSPSFHPDNIVINDNNVLKTKSSVSKTEVVRPLIGNDLWDQDPPLSNFGPATITGAPKKEDNPFTDSEGDLPPFFQGEDGSEDNVPENPFTGSSGHDNLGVEYELVGHKWDKIGLYINVRKYEESQESLLALLGGTPFETSRGYHLLIVERCIEDWEDVFAILDQMGVSKKTNPQTLMEEIYNIAIMYNPFLKLENVDLSEIRRQYKSQRTSKDRNNRRMAAGQEDSSISSKKKKRFQDVSKETLLGLNKLMREHVIGQDEAVDTVVDAIQRASVGLKRTHEPLGTFLFTGVTGSGKTETAKALAECLEANLVRIDCSEYQQPHESAKLTGCFVPGTPVLLGDGTVAPIEDIKDGSIVISHKGRQRKVLETFEYDYVGNLVELKSVGSNLPVRVTPNHEIPVIRTTVCSNKGREHVVCKPTCFRVNHPNQTCSTHNFENYKLEWLPAKDVNVGDIVVYPRFHPSNESIQRLDLADLLSDYNRLEYDDEFVWARSDNGVSHKIPRSIEINHDFMRLAGYYVAEGGKNVKHKGINFSFHYNEVEYQNEVSTLVKKIFGLDLEFKRDAQEEVLGKQRKRGWVSSKILGLLFTHLFGKNTWEKRLPSWFLDLPEDLIRSFLTTAIFGDGTTTVNRRVSYKTVSFTLHSQLKVLFSRLGYIVQTQKSLGKGNEVDSYNLLIGGNQIVRMSKEFLDLDIDLDGFEEGRIQRMSYLDEDYIYTQIKSKEILDYNGKVYDIKVDEDTSYVVHNFAVHNSPPGYVGYDDGGHLVKAVAKYPFSIVLFDEIEKAHSTFHERILQVIDDGVLTDNKGKQVSFQDTLLIMTSNIGVKEVDNLKKQVGFGDSHAEDHVKSTKARGEALKKKFKPEFLNRIDEIVNFRQLEKDDYLLILDILLNEVRDQLQNSREISLNISAGAKNFLLDHGIDKKFGARPLRRSVKKHLNTPLAKAVLAEKITGGSKVSANLKPDKSGLTFKTTDKETKD